MENFDFFFFVIDNDSWSSAWRIWKCTWKRKALHRNRRVTSTSTTHPPCLTGTEEAACLRGTLLWMGKRQAKEIHTEEFGGHFLEITWTFRFKEANWRCVLSMCKYKLSRKKNQNLANIHRLCKLPFFVYGFKTWSLPTKPLASLRSLYVLPLTWACPASAS